MADAFTVEKFNSKEQWLAARRTGIGSSDAAAILGLAPPRWGSPMSVYANKVVGSGRGREENEAMEWGTRFEGEIAKKYQETTGRKISKMVNKGFYLLRSKEMPWLIATPDRLIDPLDDLVLSKFPGAHGPGLLEIKYVFAFIKAQDWDEEPPLQYQVQLTHQLIVTRFMWGSLAALTAGPKFRWQDQAFNKSFADTYLRVIEAFWQRVIDKTPPAPDATDATRTALGLLYPTPEGDPVELPEEATDWDNEFQSVKKQIADLEERKKAAENKLRAAIGHSPAGTLPDGTSYTLKLIKKPAHPVAANEYRQLKKKES